MLSWKNEPIASSFCMARSHRSHNQSAVRSPRPLGLGLSHNYLLEVRGEPPAAPIPPRSTSLEWARSVFSSHRESKRNGSATVQRYFPVPAGSPLEAFSNLAPMYPVFELLPGDVPSPWVTSPSSYPEVTLRKSVNLQAFFAFG